MNQNTAPLVVTIMASPRTNGTIATMLDKAEQGAMEAGAEVKRLTLRDLSVHPCIACMKCRTSGICALPADDAHSVAQLLNKADSVIIATPIYWSAIPGTLKLLLDRLVYTLIDTSSTGVMPRPLQRGARLGIICACTAPWPLSITQTRPAVKSLRRIFRPAGYTVYPSLCVTGTRNLNAPKPSALKAAAALGSMLARHR